MNIMTNIATGAAPADLTHARGLLNSGGEEGVKAMYNYLAQQGYTYPRLAGGLVDDTSLAGQAAINNLMEVAQQNGQTLTAAQIQSIEGAMANAYLSALESNYQNGNYAEVGYQQAWDFHSQVFDRGETAIPGAKARA